MANPSVLEALTELDRRNELTDELRPLYEAELQKQSVAPPVQTISAEAEDQAVAQFQQQMAAPPAPTGMPVPTETPERTVLGTAGDVGIDVIKGAIGLPEAVVGLLDIPTLGHTGRMLETIGFKPEEARTILEGGYSEARKAAGEKFQEAGRDEEGFVDTTMAKFRTALMNPSIIASAVVESAPLMLGGAAAARGLMKVAPAIPALTAAAIGEGAVAMGSSAEAIRQQTADGLLDPMQAGLAIVSGTLTAAFGFLGGKVARKMGLDDIDQFFADPSSAVNVKHGLAASVLGGMFSEGVLEELPQSVQEQIMQNLALGADPFKGIEDAAVLGTLAGAAMGGGMNLRRGFSTSQKDMDKGVEKRSAIQEALGFSPDLTGATIKEQFDTKRAKLEEEKAEQLEQAQGEALMDEVGPMFAESTAIETPLEMEETVEAEPTKAPSKPAKAKAYKSKGKAPSKKATPPSKKEVVEKEKVKPIVKKVPSKRGRKPMTIEQKVTKQFEIGTKTDKGFPVLKKGEVVEYFPRKKDAQLYVGTTGTHASYEAAYKAKKPTKGLPAPRKFLAFKPEEIQDIPTSQKLPKVGSGHGRKYGKIWYPITGTKTDMTTSSPFQFALHKEGNQWAITWKGDKAIHDTVVKKYGLPIDEQGFKTSKEASQRAEKVIRALVKVYKGEIITGEKPVITKKDLVLKKFGKQNIVVRMKKSLMDYYPVHTEEGTTKVSPLPEYRIYTKFDKGLNQFVYFVQRKQKGTPNQSSRALFTTGKGVKGAQLVDSVNDVKGWLLEQIEKNGYYNALPTSDADDLKARLEGLQFEDGTTPAKPRPTVGTIEEPKAPTKAEQKKIDKTFKEFETAYDKVEAELKGLETLPAEEKAQVQLLNKERDALETHIEVIEESVEEIEDDYEEVFGQDVSSPARQELQDAKDRLKEIKLEHQIILDKSNIRKTQLDTILQNAKKAFNTGDVTSALAMLEQAGVDITVQTKVAAPSDVADVSLTSQIRHYDRLEQAAAEKIETTTKGTIGYSQLHPVWSKKASKELNGFPVYTSEDEKSIVIQYWDNNGELQYVVAEQRPTKRGYIVYQKGESTPETKQAVKDLQKHYHETMGTLSPFVPGETVTVSEQLTKKAPKFSAYAESLMKLLKLDNLQIFVAYDAETKGGKGDRYGLYGKYFQYREQAVRRKEAHGTLSKPADTKGKYVIQLQSGLNTTQTIRTFLHELGHIIYYEHFARANAATKRSIIKDWNAWKASVKIGKVKYNNMQDALEALQNSKQHDKVQARTEIQSFTEWFANRVRENVLVEEKLGGNLVTQFFKRLAKDMTTWVKQVLGIHNERDAVRSFLESIVESKSLRALGIEYIKESGWEKQATQDAAIGDRKPTKPIADTKETVTNYVKSDHIYKPSLVRTGALTRLEIDPRSTEGEFDLAMEGLLTNEEAITAGKKENTPWDWVALKQFAQPYWVKKQFEAMRSKMGISTKEGFAAIFNTSIDSRRKLSKILDKALKRNQKFFKLKDKAKLQQLTDVIYEMDTNPHLTQDLSFKFEMKLDKDLGYEVITGLNEEHYQQLKQYVMTQMEGSNLSEELAGMYIEMRKSLDRVLLRIHNMVMASVKRGETKDNILQDILDRKTLGKLNTYFPHMRFGNTYISGKDADGNTIVRHHYDNNLINKITGKSKMRGAQLAQHFGLTANPDYEALTWTNPKLVKDDNLSTILQTPIPIGAMDAFVNSALDKMELTGDMDSEARRAFRQNFQQTIASQMGEAGYRKHFLKRQNIDGYSKDPAEIKKVLHTYLTSVYSSMNKMETMRQFANDFSKINPELNPEEWRYADNYISTYFTQLDQWVTKWKQLAFSWYLGARASTAVLNLTQNFITGVQKLNMDADLSNPVMMKWVYDSGRNLSDLARTRGIPLFIKGKRLKMPGDRKLSAGEQRLVRELYSNQDAQDQLIQEMKGQAVGRGYTSTVVDKLGSFMSFAERQNRMSIALTAFRLATKGQISNAKTAKKYGYEAKQKFGEDEAIAYAADVISDTHWHYGKENLPKFFRDNQSWQAIYVFKSFPMNLMLMLREYGLHEGGRGVAAVMGSLMWAAMFGGLKGLPFEEEVDFAMKKSLGKDWKYELRKRLSEGGESEYLDILFSGLPTSVGIDLSGSIGTGFSGTQKLDPHKNAYQNALGFAEGVVGVPAAFVKDMVDGASYLNERDYWRAAEKLTPKALASVIKADRLYNKGLVSKKGYKINFPFNMEPYKYTRKDMTVRTMGFTPLSESKLFEKGEVLRFKEGEEKKVIDHLATRVSNDSMEINEAFDQLQKFNTGRAPEDFVNPKLLKDGIKSRLTPSKADKTKLFRLIQISKGYQ